MRNISIVIILMSICKAIFAENTLPQKTVGLTFSNISGYGVYADLIRNADYVLRPNAFVYFDNKSLDSDVNIHKNYQIGLELRKTLGSVLSKKLGHAVIHRRYSLVLGSYYYFDDTTKTYKGSSQSVFEDSTKLHSLSSGLGLGVEYDFKGLVFSAHVGIKAYYDISNIKDVQEQKETIIELKEAGGLSVGFPF